MKSTSSMNYKPLFEITFKVLVVVAIGVLIALQMDKKEEIVYVDTINLISNFKGVQPMRTHLENKSKAWKSNLDSLKLEAENAFANFEKGKKKASVKELKELEELAQATHAKFLNYQEATKSQYQKEELEVSKKILERVNDYLKRYGEQKGYTIILAATQYGNIAYAHKGKDVTNDVLNGLNAEFSMLGK